MITWIRPSGREITANDNKATVDYAEANGWKRKGDKVPLLEGSVNGFVEVDLVAMGIHDQISNSEDKDQISVLVKNHNGKILDLRGGLDTVRAKAIRLVGAN